MTKVLGFLLGRLHLLAIAEPDKYTVQRARVSAISLFLSQLAVQLTDTNVGVAPVIVLDPFQLLLCMGIGVLMIYLGILVFWGISVYDRIVNKVIRRHLITLVALMMFWMLMRTLRHTVFYYVFPIGQWCWYAYYIGMILIPQVCLMAAKYIGKPEDYRLPKKWHLLYIPSVALIVGILTNDLHQWAFRFHLGYEIGWDVYQRSFLYYAAVVWIFSCIALMIWQLLRRCRIPGTKK